MKNQVDEFMETPEYEAAFKGSVDERYSLNDLTGKELIPETKSYFFLKGLGASSSEVQIEDSKTYPQRLIIHYYKTTSKREAKPITQMLNTLGLNIPVLNITINKNGKMPHHYV